MLAHDDRGLDPEYSCRRRLIDIDSIVEVVPTDASCPAAVSSRFLVLSKLGNGSSDSHLVDLDGNES